VGVAAKAPNCLAHAARTGQAHSARANVFAPGFAVNAPTPGFLNGHAAERRRLPNASPGYEALCRLAAVDRHSLLTIVRVLSVRRGADRNQPGRRRIMARTTKPREPRATRPTMPGYGIPASKAGLLPWRWAADRLKKSRQYWIATTRPDGSPHVMVIWGVWLDDALYFSTGAKSRKARNLAANPKCVICTDDAAQAVILEGEVEALRDAQQAPLQRFATAYAKKYQWNIQDMKQPVYRFRPRVGFGLFESKFTHTATRWIFQANAPSSV
jgi:hypothetical protein